MLLSNHQLMAWDCLLIPGKIDEEALQRRFVAWATEASFVTQFWIAVPSEHGMDLMQRSIVDLDLANIGVVALSGSREIIQPHGPPIPDRRNAAVNAVLALPLPRARERY